MSLSVETYYLGAFGLVCTRAFSKSTFSISSCGFYHVVIKKPLAVNIFLVYPDMKESHWIKSCTDTAKGPKTRT